MAPRPVPAAAGVLLLAVALAGCTAERVCPAIAYSQRLTVTLADDWADRDDLAVRVSCPPDDTGCDLMGPVEVLPDPGPPATLVPTVPPDGDTGTPPGNAAPAPPDPSPAPAPRPAPTEAAATWDGSTMSAPARVTAEVWDVRSGELVAELPVEPEWEGLSRGGCAAPGSATVVVPAP